MKKILIILFAFISINSFGQEKGEKHNFLFNFGLSHTSNWKNRYVPPDERYWYTNQVTPLPPYTLYPSFHYYTGITYRYNFKRHLFIDFSFNYSLIPRVEEYNVDSLNKYHIYPDSLHKELATKIRTFTNIYDIGVLFGYKIKRFNFSIGIFHNIFKSFKTKYFFLNKPVSKSYNSLFFDAWYPNLQINYVFVKKHFPISIYTEIGQDIIFGIEFQLKQN